MMNAEGNGEPFDEFENKILKEPDPVEEASIKLEPVTTVQKARPEQNEDLKLQPGFQCPTIVAESSPPVMETQIGTPPITHIKSEQDDEATVEGPLDPAMFKVDCDMDLDPAEDDDLESEQVHPGPDPLELEEPPEEGKDSDVDAKPSVITGRQPRYTRNEVSGKYNCFLCSKEYNSRSEACNHYRISHLKVRYQCPLCSKDFCTRPAYDTHHKNVHNGIRFQCGECSKLFTRNETLLQHTREVHLKLKEHICGECGKGFGRLSNLQFHLKSVHSQSKDFQCNLCGRGFQTAVYLKRHAASVHFRPKEFQCEVCDKTFPRADTLSRHRRKKHPEPEGSEPGTSSTSSPVA